MTNEASVLEETMDNLREAAQRIRATQNLMHARGRLQVLNTHHLYRLAPRNGGAAPTARHALHLLYVIAVFVLALEAQVDPSVYAAVGGLLVSGNLVVGLPYNGVAGHWRAHLLWSQARSQSPNSSGLFFVRLYDIIRF